MVAFAALMLSGFFENTESTLPVDTSRLASTPSCTVVSITVFERIRNASLSSTITAWLSAPVATRSPNFTAVPSRAGCPATVAVPCSRTTPCLPPRSPAASARATTPISPAPPRAPLAAIRNSHSRRAASSMASLPDEHEVLHAVPEAAPAALELGLRAPRRPRREVGRAVLRSCGLADRTASTCSAYSCQSVATCNRPPGTRREAASAAKSGCTRRRLWWRFFGHGSGKNTLIAASEAAGTMSRSTSTASCLITRTFERPASSTIGAAALPTPGACTSMPRCSRCRGARRRCARWSRPCPKPISATTGTLRPKTAAKSSAAAL